MTALVFAIEPHQICVAMDTLVVKIDDKKPMCFQRKFLALPKKNLLIAGAGLSDLINEWLAIIPLCDDMTNIDDLNEVTPSVLTTLASEYFSSCLATTTLYHFGYSEAAGQYVGYAYRSTNAFEPEKLQCNVLGYKPEIEIATQENIQFPNFAIEVILEQQRQDKLRPLDEQVGIGGEIEYAVLSEGSIHIETVHRFASYKEELEYIRQDAETDTPDTVG